MAISEADWALLTSSAHWQSPDETPMPRVYIFYQRGASGGYWFAALAEDGTCLKAWFSESETLAMSAAQSGAWLDAYLSHYPDGYEIVWRGVPIDAAAMSCEQAASGETMSFVEGRRYCEVLAALAG